MITARGASARKISFPPPAGAGEPNTATDVNGVVKPSAWTYEDRRKLKSVDFQQLMNSSKVIGLGKKFAKVKNSGIKGLKDAGLIRRRSHS